MEVFTIYPILGIKNDVPADDPTMFKLLQQGMAETYCVDGRNVNFSKKRRACSKADGQAKWANSAAATTLNCQGIFELYDGTNRVIYIFFADGGSNGRVFRYDNSRDPARISDVVGHAGAVEFATGTTDLYTAIRYGDNMVMTDWGEHTPYCADYDDTALVKLISSGTEYKARYLESWQRRILMAYTDQSNGDIEIRWSNLMPTPGTDCTFAAGDALFVPNDDPITGVKRMGRNQCYVYCENSINRMNYLGNYNTPFGVQNTITGVGGTNHHSIVDLGHSHLFYNRDYGFCAFDGSMYVPISDDIEGIISTISESDAPSIVGCHIPAQKEVAWAVPIDGETTPNAILFFNYQNKIWRRKDITSRYIASFLWRTNLAWEDLAGYGYTTWDDFGENLRWIDLVTETPSIGIGKSDGYLYYDGTSGDDGSAWDGHRVEPIMDFGRGLDRDLLLEIWFNLESIGNYSLYCYHRSGDTVGECKSANWVALAEVPCHTPANAVTYLAETARYHQIKWGSDGAGEAFTVSSIQFKYEPQGRY